MDWMAISYPPSYECNSSVRILLRHKRENLNKLLKKVAEKPEKIVPIIQEAFELTNNELLSSEINTDLSGSTVVAVFIYG